MKKFVILLLVTALLSSCSLLKFSVDTGDKPLPKSELNTRIAVRAFYNDFVSRVVTASDSIISLSDDVDVRLNAIRWKIGSSAACAAGAYQSVPTLSLVEVWTLSLQMDQMMRTKPDSALFGVYTPIAVQASDHIAHTIDTLASKLNKPEDYLRLKIFVQKYATDNPVTDFKFNRSDMLSDLTAYLEVADTSFVGTVGTMSEVMSDLNDRLWGFGNQTGNELEWSKDLFTVKMENDSITDRLLAQVDSFSLEFKNMVFFLNNSPEILESAAAKFSMGMEPLIDNMNMSVNDAIMKVSREREELQVFIDNQRAIVMAEIDQTAQNAIEKAFGALPALIGKLIFWMVIAIVILFGLPFYLGFVIGRLKKKEKKVADK